MANASFAAPKMNRPISIEPGRESAISRRELLARSGMGMGMLAALDLLAAGNARGDQGPLNNPRSPLAEQPPHFPARAKRVVHLFMNGGPSHIDTFDPKPVLKKYDGKPLPNPALPTERKTAGALASPFRFRPYGRSGIEASELFDLTAREHMDDMCVIRSMYADAPNHEPSLLLMNCGENRLPRPSMGAWVSYALGTENENLPAFMVLCPGGYPVAGPRNWRSAFLPGAFQGTWLNTTHAEAEKLIENLGHPQPRDVQRQDLNLLNALNQSDINHRGNDPQLEARIQSFELAFRMQSEVSEAFDLSREPLHIRESYGDGVQARQLLLTRRLLERGVRFIQLWHGAGQPWDNHDDVVVNHRKLAGEWDRPLAAFLRDLKQRGMFDDTLVIWGGEFGRTPVAEMPKMTGRDHNHYGFSMWLAGGGARGGYVHGATDELGFAAVENKMHVHDLHATILHLLGLDHERLTYRYAGRDFRLTDVHGKVVRQLIT
jgi:hypothetical protein